MSKDSESNTEQQEETVNLFAEGFDDKSLLAPGDEPEPIKANNEPEGTPDVPEVPEKYRGKSIQDIIQMHQEVEKAYGRGQNELGEMRKLADQILKQQLGETEQQGKKKLTSDDLLDDPDEALGRAVADNPRVKELEARLTARERAEQMAAFNRKHPNAGELVTDPRFLKWVDESPTRKRLLQQADQTFDYELASEIISTFEQTHPTDAPKDDGKKALGNAKPSAGSGSAGKKRIFKRAELMRLKMENPDRYERLQPEIQRAYLEGRVR